MRAFWLSVLLMAWAASAVAGPTWDGLWQTADQRGQALLAQGKSAEAAKTFSDPRHKAYAELQAGRYTDAARDLAVFGDSDSQYNRGNALALSGHLKEALAAYDAALARDPHNSDAKHNRDLVKKALQSNPPPPADKNGKSQNKQGKSGASNQNGQGRQDQSGAQAGSKASKGSNGASGSGSSGSGSSGSSGAGKSGGQARATSAAASARQAQGGQAGQKTQQTSALAPASMSDAAAAHDGKNGGQNGARSGAAVGADTGTTAAAQASQDAMASMAQGQPGQKNPGVVDLPAQERKLAREQWLRSIPDDPGGLLQRKFMIEHLLRQQHMQP